ncbi:MAG: hypothetical protein HPY75_07860 [Actinobacteria bacterium]|nr:hypothetical protein [Actinomycetota bacterium]
MLFVIFSIMVIGILGALILLYTTYALRNAVGVTPAARAQAAAEAGLDVVHAMLAAGDITGNTSGITGSLWQGNGTYSVNVVKNPDMGDGDPYDWLVTSSGTYTARVEGVDRTFYRTLEEVISFAGGHYYSALDYVLFSKEGDIRFNLGGNLLQVGGILVDGSVYAGNDIELQNEARLAAGTNFEIRGDVVTERGDIIVRELNVALAASNVRISGNLFSGILTRPGDTGGGVLLETRVGIAGGGSIELTGDINASGRLRSVDQGVRIINEVWVLGGCTTRINGTIRSNRDVYAENSVRLLAGWPSIEVNGSVFGGEDVNFRSVLNIAGGTLNNNINGSIYASGNVDLYADGAVLGTMQNRVGGDIQAGGNVNIYHHFGVGCGNPSGYVVGGNIYGDSVNLDSRLGAAGTIANSVGGNIYANGPINLDNYAAAGTSRVTIGGSVYSEGNFDFYDQSGFLGTATVAVNGGLAPLNPPSANPGVYSNGAMSLSVDKGLLSTASISVNKDARRYGGSPTISSNVSVTGDKTTPLPSQFSVPEPTAPTAPTEYREVLLPECDFDYYRELAKEQELLDGQDHYFETPPSPNLDIPAGAFSSSLFVVFVEGDLNVGTVSVPVACKAVLVATGDITLQETLRREGSGDAEFQIIAGGKFLYDAGGNMTIDDNDQFFIYAAHEDYDPVSDPVSVEYEMGWFKNLRGQITARGDIELNSSGSRFSWLPGSNYSIHYKSPSVLGEAFRIPFKVKMWKEK